MKQQDNKQRLFEMMGKVAGMPLIENSMGSLPPGFATSDLIPLETDIQQTPCSTEMEEDYDPNVDYKTADMFDTIKTAKMKGGIEQEMQKSFKEKMAAYIRGDKQGIGPTGRIHSGTLKDFIVDLSTVKDRKTGEYIDPETLKGKNRKYYNVEAEDIPDFDLKKLAEILTKVPDDKQLLGQNQKMAKSNFYNISLPALKSLIYLDKGNFSPDNFYVVITCTQAKECVKWCYAQMGNYVQYDDAIRLKMQKLNYLINHWEEWKNRIIQEIQKLETKWNKVNEETVVRWHDAGDFISPKYLQIAFEIAEATPNVTHYAYTKEIASVKNSKIPPNFEFKFSLEGHQVGDLEQGDVLGVVAPAELFKQYLKPKPPNVSKKEWEESDHGMWGFSDDEKRDVERKIIDYFTRQHPNKQLFADMNLNNVIWHDEYMKMPHDRALPQERKWWVIIKSGDTDIPASRKDTQGIINLLHK